MNVRKVLAIFGVLFFLGQSGEAIGQPAALSRLWALAGWFDGPDGLIELVPAHGDATATPDGVERLAPWLQLVSALHMGPLLETDSGLAFPAGAIVVPIQLDASGLMIDGRFHRRLPPEWRPGPPPPATRPYLGTFADADRRVVVLEHGGRLVLLDRGQPFVLEVLGEHRFRAPGLEAVLFGADGEWLSIEGRRLTRQAGLAGPGRGPVIPLERPLADALAAAQKVPTPAPAPGETRPVLVEIPSGPGLRHRDAYAGPDNVFGGPLYARPWRLLAAPAAADLVKVVADLSQDGLGLVVHDSFRPYCATVAIHLALRPDNRSFGSSPAAGSPHNRGSAIDVGLFDRATGVELDTVAAVDELTDRAAAWAVAGTTQQRWRRHRLMAAFETNGFVVAPNEWWHFDHKSWAHYAILANPTKEGAR